jgi:hypothetical protein
MLNLDIRTNKTIPEGIVSHVQRNPSGIIHDIRYAPGNGTGYHLIFVKLDEDNWLVTLMNTMHSMIVVKSTRILHYTYVSEKLGCSISDGICLAEIIGLITDRPFVTCDDVRGDTLSAPKTERSH